MSSLTTNVVDSQNLSYYASSSASSNNISVMYYIMESMHSHLNSAKLFDDHDKDDQEERIMQQALEGASSLSAKEVLLAFFKKSMESADSSVKAWINAMHMKIQDYQKQIDDGIKSYQDALNQLNKSMDLARNVEKAADSLYQKYEKLLQKARSIHTHWYEPWTYIEKAAFYVAADAVYVAYLTVEATVKFLRSRVVKELAGIDETHSKFKKQKESLENQIQQLINKSNHSTKDLQQLQRDFKQLVDVVKKEVESSGIYKIIKWFSGASHAIESKKSWPDWFIAAGGYIVASILTVIGSLFSLLNHFGGGELYKDQETFGKTGETIAGMELNIDDQASNLSKIGKNELVIKLQLNQKARDDYEDIQKQVNDEAKIFNQMFINNAV